MADQVEKSKDTAERVKAAAAMVAAIAACVVPVVVAFVGNAYSQSQDRETRLEYIKLALQILQAPPDGDESLRHWAVDILEVYSSVPMPVQAREKLAINSLPLTAVSESKLPASAVCFQERVNGAGGFLYSVYCFTDAQRCEQNRRAAPRSEKSACEAVGVGGAAWKPKFDEKRESWFEDRREVFPMPFPKTPTT